jgi:hypothetical protein
VHCTPNHQERAPPINALAHFDPSTGRGSSIDITTEPEQKAAARSLDEKKGRRFRTRRKSVSFLSRLKEGPKKKRNRNGTPTRKKEADACEVSTQHSNNSHRGFSIVVIIINKRRSRHSRSLSKKEVADCPNHNIVPPRPRPTAASTLFEPDLQVKVPSVAASSSITDLTQPLAITPDRLRLPDDNDSIRRPSLSNHNQAPHYNNFQTTSSHRCRYFPRHLSSPTPRRVELLFTLASAGFSHNAVSPRWPSHRVSSYRINSSTVYPTPA